MLGLTTCLIGVIALGFSACSYWQNNQSQSSSGKPELASSGSSPHAADFDLTAVGAGGKKLNLQDDRGKVIVLNVWATWCGPCMQELPGLGKLAAHYSADRDVAIVCISNESSDTVFKSSAASVGAPIYSLDGHDLPDVYKTDAIPATFIINKSGQIVSQEIGSSDWADPSVIKYIDSLR